MSIQNKHAKQMHPINSCEDLSMSLEEHEIESLHNHEIEQSMPNDFESLEHKHTISSTERLEHKPLTRLKVLLEIRLLRLKVSLESCLEIQ